MKSLSYLLFFSSAWTALAAPFARYETPLDPAVVEAEELGADTASALYPSGHNPFPTGNPTYTRGPPPYPTPSTWTWTSSHTHTSTSVNPCSAYTRIQPTALPKNTEGVGIAGGSAAAVGYDFEATNAAGSVTGSEGEEWVQAVACSLEGEAASITVTSSSSSNNVTTNSTANAFAGVEITDPNATDAQTFSTSHSTSHTFETKEGNFTESTAESIAIATDKQGDSATATAKIDILYGPNGLVYNHTEVHVEHHGNATGTAGANATPGASAYEESPLFVSVESSTYPVVPAAFDEVRTYTVDAHQEGDATTGNAGAAANALTSGSQDPPASVAATGHGATAKGAAAADAAASSSDAAAADAEGN